jgi:hypothetical protein
MKQYKCICCGKGLTASNAIFANNKGILMLTGGKPYCPECLPSSNEADYEEDTIEEKIDKLANDS